MSDVYYVSLTIAFCTTVTAIAKIILEIIRKDK